MRYCSICNKLKRDIGFYTDNRNHCINNKTNACKTCLKRKAYKRSAKYRLKAIKKAKIKCNHCGFKPKNIMELNCFEFHHTLNNTNRSNAYFDYLHDLEGVIMLCKNCHRIADIKMNKGKKSIFRFLTDEEIFYELDTKRFI